MICKHCKIEMTIGLVIDPRYEENGLPVTGRLPITAENMDIVNCWKCPRCGHSEFLSQDDIDAITSVYINSLTSRQI